MYLMYLSLGLSFATCFIHCVQEGRVPSGSGHTPGYGIFLLIVRDTSSMHDIFPSYRDQHEIQAS